MTLPDGGNSDPKDVEDAIPEGETKTPVPPDDVNKVVDATQVNLYVEQLLAQQPQEESVCDTSDVKEVRTFSKREILEEIARFAVANKLELKGAEIPRIITNKEGAIVVLEVKFFDPDKSYKLVGFIIKGKHGRIQSKTTAIDRTFWDKEDMPINGTIVVEYQEGRWVSID